MSLVRSSSEAKVLGWAGLPGGPVGTPKGIIAVHCNQHPCLSHPFLAEITHLPGRRDLAELGDGVLGRLRVRGIVLERSAEAFFLQGSPHDVLQDTGGVFRPHVESLASALPLSLRCMDNVLTWAREGMFLPHCLMISWSSKKTTVP